MVANQVEASEKTAGDRRDERVRFQMRSANATSQDANTCALISAEAYFFAPPWTLMFSNEVQYRNQIVECRAVQIQKAIQDAHALAEKGETMDVSRFYFAQRTDTGQDVSFLQWKVTQVPSDALPPTSGEDAVKRQKELHAAFIGVFNEDIVRRFYGALGEMHYNEWKGKGKHVYVNMMGTLTKHMQLGAASFLLGAMIREVDSSLCLPIVLEASDSGRPIYEKFGFEVVGEPLYFSDEDSKGGRVTRMQRNAAVTTAAQ